MKNNFKIIVILSFVLQACGSDKSKTVENQQDPQEYFNDIRECSNACTDSVNRFMDYISVDIDTCKRNKTVNDQRMKEIQKKFDQLMRQLNDAIDKVDQMEEYDNVIRIKKHNLEYLQQLKDLIDGPFSLLVKGLEISMDRLSQRDYLRVEHLSDDLYEAQISDQNCKEKMSQFFYKYDLRNE